MKFEIISIKHKEVENGFRITTIYNQDGVRCKIDMINKEKLTESEIIRMINEN